MSELLEQIAEDVREIRNKLDRKADAEAHEALETRVRGVEKDVTRFKAVSGAAAFLAATFGLPKLGEWLVKP